MQRRVDLKITRELERKYSRVLKKFYDNLSEAIKEINYDHGILTKQFNDTLKSAIDAYGKDFTKLLETTFLGMDKQLTQAYYAELYKQLPAAFRHESRKYKFEKTDEDIKLFEFVQNRWKDMTQTNYAATAWVMNKPALDGIKLSKRIWLQAEKTAEDIKTLLTASLQTGMSATRVRNQILKTQTQKAPEIPAYLKKQISMLSPEGTEKVIERYTNKKMRYNAMRVARTEIQRAWRGSYVEMTKKLPFVKGVKWNLSANHPVYDICDELATANMGLGPGVYPPNGVPYDGQPAHPHCRCYLSSELDSVESFVDSL
ncbi:MAG TPA: hypothetical protein PLP59_11820 [Thermotogota bacterium]|nr:hypothetical protein [Thermotogota bacterium]